MMVSSLVGLSCSGVAIFVAWSKAVRYQRFLPKRDIVKSLADLEAELQSVRGEWIQAQSDIRRRDELAQEKQELTERINGLRDEASQLESSRRHLEETRTDLERAREELTTEEGRLSDLRIESAELTKAIESQRAEVLSPEEFEQRQSERRELRAALDLLERKVSGLRDDLQTLEANRQDAQEVLRELDEKRDQAEIEVRSLRAEVAEKSTQRDELAQHMEDLRRRATDLGGSTEALDDDQATALLWTPTLHANDFSGLAPSDLEEEKALAAAQERIREAGFIYHDRVLRAFHTSLKCAEDAPLTVLAGISGTGKSALPTKYAEAMGIHLGTVPVQPSWDSPADLTGFYNHLEGRFRPTDLTRALIQLDYVHGPDSEDPWPASCEQRVALGDQMLLVLLDEMNLARVEYYFSEFLSRLELRRGVADNDIVARRRSELILDLSASGVKGAQSLHVFVGRNVLFVGTMNEDESTQTLSDKVIDRSNLMRFGRPKRLQLDGADKPRIAKAAALPRQTWSRWVEQGNQLNDFEASRLDGWIETLNDIVSKVGRPFAYRVSEAIRSYARQYPRNTGTGLEDSIADQVELRILPRLRGIDLHDPASKSAVDDLRRLVDDELGDADLSNALEAARAESGDQLFHWSGFDRS
jgi:predicted nuclease with TOPRIM domain